VTGFPLAATGRYRRFAGLFSQVSGLNVTGSIPGSSTKKKLVRATSSGQFSLRQDVLTIFILSPTVVPLLKVERWPGSYSTDAKLRLDLHA
jgi:hypothetical protein